MTSNDQNDNIYNESYIWVVLYKDELHSQTGSDYEVAYAFKEEYEAIGWLSQFCPDYVKKHFKVVKTTLY